MTMTTNTSHTYTLFRLVDENMLKLFNLGDLEEN